MRVCSGEIEVLREVGSTSILLGHVREGEWLGEMGVIEHRARSATARAGADSAVEIMAAQQFLDRVSSDPALARALIMRLSIRLRKIEDKIVETLVPIAPEAAPEVPDGPASRPMIGDVVTVTLAARTEALRARLGAAPIRITSLPYVVGRRPAAHEAEPPRPPDLLIEDEKPFRLSRDHFMIARSHDQLVLSDLGSALGTIVNGQAVGYHFMRDAAPLQRGENLIIAGGRGSPFEFMVSVG
jgi:CRP-like cAMP-binding protein